MLSHDSIAYTSQYASVTANLKPFEEIFVTYLPLSHIAAKMVDMYLTLFIGATVYFAQPDALKGSLSVTLKEARPTFFWGMR